VESAEQAHYDASLIAKDAPKVVSRLSEVVNDTRISEAARAKMYYYATGKKLPTPGSLRSKLTQSAGVELADLKASLENDRQKRVDFESSFRQRLDEPAATDSEKAKKVKYSVHCACFAS